MDSKLSQLIENAATTAKLLCCVVADNTEFSGQLNYPKERFDVCHASRNVMIRLALENDAELTANLQVRSNLGKVAFKDIDKIDGFLRATGELSYSVTNIAGYTPIHFDLTDEQLEDENLFAEMMDENVPLADYQYLLVDELVCDINEHEDSPIAIAIGKAILEALNR